MGDYQARFCERLGVKLPLPTRLCDRCVQFEKNFAFIPIFGIFEKITNSNEQKHINIARKLF